MFASAFWHQRLGAGSAVGGAVYGLPPTYINAIPRWADTTGTQLDSSQIYITNSNDILMSKSGENAIIFKRLGTIGSYTDPQFDIARLAPISSGEVTFRFSFSSFSDPLRTVMLISSDGEIASVRQTQGAHFQAFVDSELNPTISLTSDPTPALMFADPVLDVDFDTSISRSGNQTISFNTGTDSLSLIQRASINPSSLTLAYGVSAGFTDIPSTPIAPPPGVQYIYSKNGFLYRLNELNEEVVLENLPVVSFEAGYANNQNNGFLRGLDGEFTNISPFIVPFDSDIIGIIASCFSAVNEWRAQVFVNNSALPLLSLTVLNTETRKGDEPIGITVDKSDELSVYLLKGPGGLGGGANIPSPKVQIYMRKRIN